MRHGAAALTLALILLLVGRGGLTGLSAQAQPAGTIRIIGPANGATVSAPVMLQVEITGVTIKPADEGDPQAYHYHALVDVDPAVVAQTGQPLPTGQASIIHTAVPTLALPDLAPGPHTITVILTRTDHVPLQPSVQAPVSFTVAAAASQAAPQAAPAQAAPAAAPRTGHGGAVLADNHLSLPHLLTLAALVLLSGGSTLLWAHRRR